jgi:hypothetical protein
MRRGVAPSARSQTARGLRRSLFARRLSVRSSEDLSTKGAAPLRTPLKSKGKIAVTLCGESGHIVTWAQIESQTTAS